MPTPIRPCRWCGSDHFIEAERLEWQVSGAGGANGHLVSGSLVACARCGLIESFADDPRVLLDLPGSHEVRVPGADRDGASAASVSESPAGSGWQVVMLDAGPQPIGVIAALRQELPISLANARAAVKRLPWVLTRTSNRRMADEISEKLTIMGAVVRVEPSTV